MIEGWKCPVCGRGVAPSEKYCDHGGGIAAIPLPQPWNPLAPNSGTPLPPWPTTTCVIGRAGPDGWMIWNGGEWEQPQISETHP